MYIPEKQGQQKKLVCGQTLENRMKL